MDISFFNNTVKFNYRVCALIINDNKILAMKDERSPYYYLPGGTVQFGETAEDAVIREVKEELQIDAKIIRPLWVLQKTMLQLGMQIKSSLSQEQVQIY